MDFLLAVGGGSVIDSAKAIALGLAYEGDVWDLFSGQPAQDCLPVGTVLTIAAAGSEMSNSCVITNEDGWKKRGLNTDLCRPRFAVMDPELTFTLPAYQTASGCVDIIYHTMERYFSGAETVEPTDSMAEGLMRSMLELSRRVVRDPRDYDARAGIMWAGSLSHNSLTGCGRGGRGIGGALCAFASGQRRWRERFRRRGAGAVRLRRGAAADGGARKDRQHRAAAARPRAHQPHGQRRGIRRASGRGLSGGVGAVHAVRAAAAQGCSLNSERNRNNRRRTDPG